MSTLRGSASLWFVALVSIPAGCSSDPSSSGSAAAELQARAYTCELNVHFRDGDAKTVRGPDLVESGQVSTWSLSLRRADGRHAELRSSFVPLTDRAGASATVVSPFDGTTWAHDDGAGTTTFSPSMASMVEDVLRANPGSRDALTTYHVVQVDNPTGTPFTLDERPVSRVFVSCVIGRPVP